MSDPIRYEFIYNENFCSVEREEHPEGDYVSYEDYARLKAEVERLTLLQSETLAERNKAEEQVERLTKAGDAMMDWIDHQHDDSGYPHSEAWEAAKEGKQP